MVELQLLLLFEIPSLSAAISAVQHCLYVLLYHHSIFLFYFPVYSLAIIAAI